MRVLITGACGFVGTSIITALLKQIDGLKVYGLDNFIRPGSQHNLKILHALGVRIIHADMRSASDTESLPEVDWVIDAAANPSVLAGVDGSTSSRQLIEHNLFGTINILEYCKRANAGLILLSTSRVYSIPGLSGLELQIEDRAYSPCAGQTFPEGISPLGISEKYSTQAPVSLYGVTKVASESIALEYGATFNLPVRVNRCGVLAGAGQFGRADQGIFSYWIHSWKQRRQLKYIGFDGRGHQVRDCLHPDDLASMLSMQLRAGTDKSKPSIQNLSGGPDNKMSLRQLSDWCSIRFKPADIGTEPNDRPFDIPWIVLDSTTAKEGWQWEPQRSIESVLEEIAKHAEEYPGWLDISAAY